MQKFYLLSPKIFLDPLAKALIYPNKFARLIYKYKRGSFEEKGIKLMKRLKINNYHRSDLMEISIEGGNKVYFVRKFMVDVEVQHKSINQKRFFEIQSLERNFQQTNRNFRNEILMGEYISINAANQITTKNSGAENCLIYYCN